MVKSVNIIILLKKYLARKKRKKYKVINRLTVRRYPNSGSARLVLAPFITSHFPAFILP